MAGSVPSATVVVLCAPNKITGKKAAMLKADFLEKFFIVPDTSRSTFISVGLLRRMDGWNHGLVNGN